MDNATCNIVYVDRNVRRDEVANNAVVETGFSPECEHLSGNLRLLRDVFNDIHLCATGTECISTLASLHGSSMIHLKPTLVLVDMPYDEKVPAEPARSRSPSPHSVPPPEERLGSSTDEEKTPKADMYGLRLLERVVSESLLRNLSRLVVPIPIIRPPLANGYPDSDGDCVGVDAETVAGLPNGKRRSAFLPNRKLLKRCLDLGAIDVITSPMTEKTLVNLEVQAYRAHKDAAKEQQAMLEVRRGRKRSWVGVNEEKPFAYLREAMVSGLMNGICRVGGGDHDSRVMGVQLDVPAERHAKIAEAVGKWHFCAHSFSEDELVVAARVIFKHALSMPEFEKWRIPTDQLTSFLVACKAAYNNFVPYHNFRHVVDVLQATFHLLVSIGALAPYPADSDEARLTPVVRSPLGALIEPHDALTLLITAIGHDVGHPGVNNGFLVTLNAPLAQLYNDRSVLESFHCAAYSQILRRYWPTAFEEADMRKLMISSILATDMGLHFDYMKKLGDAQEKLQERNTTEGWNGRMLEDHKTLVCSLIIKCADISNVARKHDAALRWMYILNDEFSRQVSMEDELSITSSLYAPLKKDPVSLYQSQIGFMNIFAIPLFQGVADIMPTLKYTVDELDINKALFEDKIAAAELPRRGRFSQEAFSPRTMSLVASDDMAVKVSDQRALKNSSSTEDATDSSSGPTTNSFETPRGTVPRDDASDANGVSTFDAVNKFAESDPFGCNDPHPLASDKQRCSETTEGSSSAPYCGDWASQATSATTGKMPQSPSTQGTSIVSRDSLDPPNSVLVTTVISPENQLLPEPQLVESRSVVDDESNASTNDLPSPQPRRLVKKKSSIFKINALNFFRKHKSPSPPVPPIPPQSHLQPHETVS
ncbi:putative 3,5-cyclic-nucleotide phosphodiesterase 2 [Zalerion maritima]|uniref:Phosphodiesterase n=1 Tax=Zalerion maritima TaxID=339359 RepID=A0AAD5RWM3_9PEZI|nr:putative 3,5-cyclic-nucleotide phosphodiesterase 2 [Zalerion maritima]